MDLLKKHMDTLIILGALASSMLWVNGRFNDIEKRLFKIEVSLSIIKIDYLEKLKQ